MVKYKTDVSYSPTEPLRIVESKSPIFFFSGDLGITIGTGVSAWADQSGNGRTASQGTAGSQPTFNGLGLNNKGTVTFDGTDDALSISYIPPAPGTTASWYWFVFNPITIVNGQYVFASGGGRHRLGQSTSNRHFLANTTSSSLITSTPNAWYRGKAYLNNNTTDYLTIGSTSVTGTNTGNNAGSTAFYIGSSSGTGTNPGNVSFAAFGAWNGEPTAAEMSELDMWVQRYYGGSVTI